MTTAPEAERYEKAEEGIKKMWEEYFQYREELVLGPWRFDCRPSSRRRGMLARIAWLMKFVTVTSVRVDGTAVFGVTDA